MKTNPFGVPVVVKVETEGDVDARQFRRPRIGHREGYYFGGPTRITMGLGSLL